MALIFVAAFENLAVTTVMPVISAELNGEALYAVAFAAPLAASVVGMVVAGIWCDRTGPRAPLLLAVALFTAGLVIAGTAASMEWIVAGRLVQGLGSGATTVCLYVIVARVYPPALQARMFGLFSAAWVLPALVGPFVAGIVGETVGWRWVFIGVVALIVPSAFMIAPAMRTLRATDTDEPRTRARWPLARTAWSVVLAVAVLALSVSTEFGGAAVFVVAVLALVVALVALRPLVPAGVLLARIGLPSIITTRFLLAGAFFSTEVYLPYLLTSEHGLNPAFAGLTLTTGGVAWGAASVIQSPLSGRFATGVGVPIGIAAVVLAIGVVAATAFWSPPVWVAVLGWTVSGAGMGLAYPRLSTLLLGRSERAEQGFNSAALNIADGAGPAMALALAGILFQTMPGASGLAFTGVFVLGLACALAALLVSPRALAR
ncbi:MAG: MFS transporter [Herbiconiux sp.]|nr:MAG: MFS transporter [Herbiconiux sp.]